MAILDRSEYTQSYFEGNHPAGYTKYDKWNRVDLSMFSEAESTGEFYSDIAKKFKLLAFLDGKRVLELGCAKGYTIEWLRNNGIDANGLDICQWIVDQSAASIKPYITVADVMTHLPTLGRNAYNVLYSKDFLCCFSDADIATLITQMNRVGFLQVHQIRDGYNSTYYNNHTMDWWASQPFKKGTILINGDDFNNYRVV